MDENDFLNRHIKWLDKEVDNNREPYTTCNVSFVDFGVSRLYIDKNTKKHVPNVQVSSFVGNAIFASPNALMGLTLSRRDDLV